MLKGLLRIFMNRMRCRAGETWDATLAQLLVKCSKLFSDSGMGELHLLLYLIPQGYRTHAIYMMRARKTPSKFSRGNA